MDLYSERMIEAFEDERDRNEKLSMRADALEEEISYLRPMVRYLIQHLSAKPNLDEIYTIEKMKEDLEYFKEKNYDIEDACVYGPKDPINYAKRML